MLLFKTILIVIFGCFRLIWANLKPCSDSEDSELEICLTGIGKYHPPFPSTVEIDINLREIVRIDKHKKSITIRLGFTTHWKDPRLALKNDSKM